MEDDMIDMDLMKQELIRDEGIKPYAYQDSLGYWTIGVGRLIDHRKGGKLSDEEIDHLLQNDIQASLSDIQSEVWFQGAETDDQKRGLLNMRFQLGSKGIRSFKIFLGLMEQKKFKEAADDLRGTLWYKQVPERAERVCRLINPIDPPSPEQSQ